MNLIVVNSYSGVCNKYKNMYIFLLNNSLSKICALHFKSSEVFFKFNDDNTIFLSFIKAMEVNCIEINSII